MPDWPQALAAPGCRHRLSADASSIGTSPSPTGASVLNQTTWQRRFSSRPSAGACSPCGYGKSQEKGDARRYPRSPSSATVSARRRYLPPGGRRHPQPTGVRTMPARPEVISPPSRHGPGPSGRLLPTPSKRPRLQFGGAIAAAEMRQGDGGVEVEAPVEDADQGLGDVIDDPRPPGDLRTALSSPLASRTRSAPWTSAAAARLDPANWLRACLPRSGAKAVGELVVEEKAMDHEPRPEAAFDGGGQVTAWPSRSTMEMRGRRPLVGAVRRARLLAPGGRPGSAVPRLFSPTRRARASR